MTFLETVLGLASRGFHVLPLKPCDKWPIVAGGYKAGTTDVDQLELWWKKHPQANIGIATGESDLVVMDADHGLTSYEEFIAWRDRNALPPTYTVHSGRRPEYGAQMYYRRKGGVTTQGRKTFRLDGVTGDFKSQGGLVVHPPSIHPESGAAYQLACDLSLADCPEFILSLPTADGEKAKGQTNEAGLLDCNRNDDMCSFVNKIRKQIAGLSDPECLTLCLIRNDRYAKGPMDLDEVEEIVHKQYRLYPNVAPDAVLTIGGTKPDVPDAPVDWRSRYHTFDEMNNAPKPSFLIDGFLQKDVITAIAAPVGQRKTIVACNAARALLTGEPLFDHFAVAQRPSRVLYLCPEMGLFSFADRMRNLGLLPYVGKTLFCRTMNSEGHLTLTDLTADELAGAVVIVDTAVRFVIGDENSSEDMKVFAENCFRLMKAGAASVLVLFHSAKGTKEASELTLENAMRGSGDLGAFVSSCWATRLQDPDNDEWKSPSYVKNVKQRDFKSKPFEVTSDEQGRLHIVAPPSAEVVLNGKPKGAKGNADGREEDALQVIRDNPTLSLSKIVHKLDGMGIQRSKSWVGNKRFDLLHVGVKTG
jgi:Bifunctional DNA primase/polymerase, N-terminal/AAA domain